jgi:protein-S-isoprenylcysteine O-methyltransferase Ste14
MRSDFHPQAVWLASFTERYILSLLFLAFAWLEFTQAMIEWRVLQYGGDHTDLTFLIQHIIMVLLNVSIGTGLLFGQPMAVAPQSIEEIIVPLLATFFYLAYSSIDSLPPWLSDNVVPPDWQAPVAACGLVLGVLGRVIAAWGAFYLGRSFGIFVSVREVVLRGPYRYVRHPIYLGYLLLFAGLALAYGCTALFFIVPTHFGLFAWRARLEETRLAEASPAYREYMRRTGRFFPKLLPTKKT